MEHQHLSGACWCYCTRGWNLSYLDNIYNIMLALQCCLVLILTYCWINFVYALFRWLITFNLFLILKKDISDKLFINQSSVKIYGRSQNTKVICSDFESKSPRAAFFVNAGTVLSLCPPVLSSPPSYFLLPHPPP